MSACNYESKLTKEARASGGESVLRDTVFAEVSTETGIWPNQVCASLSVRVFVPSETVSYGPDIHDHLGDTYLVLMSLTRCSRLILEASSSER